MSEYQYVFQAAAELLKGVGAKKPGDEVACRKLLPRVAAILDNAGAWDCYYRGTKTARDVPDFGRALREYTLTRSACTQVSQQHELDAFWKRVAKARDTIRLVSTGKRPGAKALAEAIYLCDRVADKEGQRGYLPHACCTKPQCHCDS